MIRGTIWREEWCKDFMYRWAKDDAHLFPGRTHGGWVPCVGLGCSVVFECGGGIGSWRVLNACRLNAPALTHHNHPITPKLKSHAPTEGMYSVFVDFYQELEAEVMAKRPTHIFVTGHSLGAGLANMVGLRLQKSLDYTPGVDVVSFGGPNTGDEEFAEAFRQGVNSRHIIFLGHGAEPDPAKYTAGDICAQYTCESYPGCDILDTGPNGAWYHYVRPHNQVGSVRVCCVTDVGLAWLWRARSAAPHNTTHNRPTAQPFIIKRTSHAKRRCPSSPRSSPTRKPGGTWPTSSACPRPPPACSPRTSAPTCTCVHTCVFD